MKINASITISRDSNDIIRLQIQDEASRAIFARLEFSPHDFMMAITGLSSVHAKSAEVAGLDVVGKRKIIEQRSIIYPSQYSSREEMRAWLEENGREDGWIVNSYLGSQCSVRTNGDTTKLNYSVYRFESVSEKEQNNG